MNKTKTQKNTNKETIVGITIPVVAWVAGDSALTLVTLPSALPSCG